MKVSRYAVLALATAVVFGLVMSPVMAQSTTPTPTTQDASKDAMKSSSDAMKSSSDEMKSSSDAMKSDATKTGTHHKKHNAPAKKAADTTTPPASGG
ncbi:hypothetical protein [Dyella sp. 20L07]|uniref:hypothetical protein n=1 Tax=Dyella sp. 20L07 TaxID=3384240 RepID=UPI003D2A1E27